MFGSSEVAIAVHEVPEPHVGAVLVRIRAKAFTVNPTEAVV